MNAAWLRAHRNEVLGAAAAFGLLIAYMVHKRGAGQPATTTSTSGTAGLGSSSGGGSIGQDATGQAYYVDPSGQSVTPIGSTGGLGGFGTPPGSFPDPYAPAAPTTDPGASVAAPPPAATAVDNSQPAAPAASAPAPSSKAAAGFWWGGQWVTSIGQLATFERAHGNAKFNSALWAAEHPDAARAIGVNPPPPPPNPSTATHADAPTSGVARSSSSVVAAAGPAVRAPSAPAAPAKVGSTVTVSTIRPRTRSLVV